MTGFRNSILTFAPARETAAGVLHFHTKLFCVRSVNFVHDCGRRLVANGLAKTSHKHCGEIINFLRSYWPISAKFDLSTVLLFMTF